MEITEPLWSFIKRNVYYYVVCIMKVGCLSTNTVWPKKKFLIEFLGLCRETFWSKMVQTGPNSTKCPKSGPKNKSPIIALKFYLKLFWDK